MDDPVSALDANVKKRIFSKVFNGDLANKTRILVTHAVDFLEHVDRIIVMEGGKVKAFGTYNELKGTDEL
jgi:ABC-type multidrug transport system ATPase subunit